VSIEVEEVVSELDFGQTVARVRHFRTVDAARAYALNFNKGVNWSAERYLYARVYPRRFSEGVPPNVLDRP
jgi:hypothetical protein